MESLHARTFRTLICSGICLGGLLLTSGCGQPSGAADSPAPSARAGAQAPKAKTASPPKKKADAQSGAASLDEALALAKSSLESLEKIKDYTCIFVKRERVSGELLPEERLQMKVRHQPFSVYMRFLEPVSLAGQEAIFVEGENDGKLVGHATGISGQVVGTVALDPTGYLAMRNNRYPITNAGMKKLVALLLELGGRKDLLQDCRVKFIENERVDDRPCVCVDIRNPRGNGDFKLAIARIWLDKKWNVPVRFESWEWPDETGKEPELVEQYKYLQLKFNQGLTARDFDPKNPKYAFP
jgi:hypothetical protein